MTERSRELRARLADVRSRIEDACDRSGRASSEVRLIAVSKTHSADDIQALYDVGHRDFGENYVQEWREKFDALPDDIIWHFIGRLQSNKVKYLADRVGWIHGVDKPKQLKQIQSRFLEPVNVLVQMNTGNDVAKGGLDADDLAPFLETASGFPMAKVGGLMTIPPFGDPIEVTRSHFAAMAKWGSAAGLAELSMGMTSDFEVAIAEGATMVRVGTAIFGARSYP